MQSWDSYRIPARRSLGVEKDELDGAADDPRFDDDFFIELIYRDADEEDMKKAQEYQQSRVNSELVSKAGSKVDLTSLGVDDNYWIQLAGRAGMSPLTSHGLQPHPLQPVKEQAKPVQPIPVAHSSQTAPVVASVAQPVHQPVAAPASNSAGVNERSQTIQQAQQVATAAGAAAAAGFNDLKSKFGNINFSDVKFNFWGSDKSNGQVSGSVAGPVSAAYAAQAGQPSSLAPGPSVSSGNCE